MKLDKTRTDFLEKIGFHVMRFTNKQIIENIDDVIKQIEGDIYDNNKQI